MLKQALVHPVMRGRDIDAPETTRLRSQIIQEKGFLRQVYDSWYSQLTAHIPRAGEGTVLEIGTGVGFLQRRIQGLIRSDIFLLPGLDVVLDGGKLPLKKNSLKGIVMIDVFHHLPDVASFLKEAARCVRPDGFICMVEPWVTSWSKMIYTYLHHEPFDPEARTWQLETGRPLSGANQAMAWIVFSRDAAWFRKKHPEWRVRRIEPHTPFAYLLSGGVSLRSLIPAGLYKAVKRFEGRFSESMETWAMFATIILRRVDDRRHAEDTRS